MTDKVPFGGVYGWLGDLTSQKAEHQSYYVAEPAMHRAMTAIRAHASKDAIVTLRRGPFKAGGHKAWIEAWAGKSGDITNTFLPSPG